MVRVFIAVKSNSEIYILVSDTQGFGGSKLKLMGDAWDPTSPTSGNNGIMGYVVTNITAESEPTVTPDGYVQVLEVTP